MGDPFTALAAACAALQFLDFGAKFVEKTYKAYKSSDGTVRDVAELDAAVERLKVAAEANDNKQLHCANASEAEKGMVRPCSECRAFADQLSRSLASFKTNDKPGLRNSAKMVLRAERRKEELRASAKRVEALRSEMNAQLLRILGMRARLLL